MSEFKESPKNHDLVQNPEKGTVTTTLAELNLDTLFSKGEILASVDDETEMWKFLKENEKEDFPVPYEFISSLTDIKIIFVKTNIGESLAMFITGKITAENAFKLGGSTEGIEEWKFFEDNSVWFQSNSVPL